MHGKDSSWASPCRERNLPRPRSTSAWKGTRDEAGLLRGPIEARTILSSRRATRVPPRAVTGNRPTRLPQHLRHHNRRTCPSSSVPHCQRRRGLIIDPGAANGLVGSETLRDLLAHVDMAKQVNRALEWKPKRSEVTGISGAADTTLGEITMKLPMLSGLDGAHYKLQGRRHRWRGIDVSGPRWKPGAREHEVHHGVELVHAQGRSLGHSYLKRSTSYASSTQTRSSTSFR